MIFWRNIQSLSLLTLILIPSLLLLKMTPDRVVLAWTLAWLAFFAAQLQRVKHRRAAESLSPNANRKTTTP